MHIAIFTSLSLILTDPQRLTLIYPGTHSTSWSGSPRFALSIHPYPYPVCIEHTFIMFSQTPLLRLAFVGLLAMTVQARKVTVANLCGAPLWAAYNGQSSEKITVNGKAGTGMWKQESGQEDELDVPETCRSLTRSCTSMESRGEETDRVGQAGRIWPATGCDASGTNCMVGGCGAAKW